ncbi:kelch-like protein 33 [Arapaima gigas]
MELMKRQLPRNWEERWRKEKEQRKKMQEEGGEGLEAENRKLRWIVAHNSLKMGVRGSKEHGEERQEQYEEKEDEETAPMFHSHRHPVEMFQATREFRDSGLLTDVTLRTSDGGCFSLHFPIMAAVSSLLCQQLQHRDKERKPEEKSDGNETKELSIPMGPEVESTGLAAVVEFAYTGTIMNLNRYTLAQVRAAAKALQVSRILELCSEKEEKVMAKGAEKPQERIISSERQLEISLEHIEHLRKTRLGCDVELEAEGRIFHAHRVVLAASSDYFRGMFTSGMRESYRQTIALLSLGSVELEALLNCSYSGSLPLSWGSVFQTTATALQLQVQPALSLCFEFLHQQIDANSCLDVASFAEAFGLADLQELAKDFVLRHFTEVAATPKFLDLPSDKLLEYLHCDSLCAPSELAVFRAVVAWIEADPEERMVFAKDLMKGVRFQLMTFREFREVRAINLRMECAGEKEVELYGAALKEFGFGLSNSQDQSRVRHPNDSLLVIGGDNLDPDFGQRRPSRQLWYINSLWSKTGLVKEVEWRLLGEMPESARLRHAVSVLGGQLYVAGGCHYYATADTLKSVYRYDPLQNTWQRLADMNEQRSNFSLVVRDKQLYAIGGDRIINNNLDSVECYCPESNCWR